MVLLVIDTQKGITDGRLYAFERFRENVKLLIAEARANGVEVVYVRHDDGPGTGFSLGDEEFEIFGEFAPAGDERIFDKTVNSALHSSTHLPLGSISPAMTPNTAASDPCLSIISVCAFSSLGCPQVCQMQWEGKSGSTQLAHLKWISLCI